MSRVTKAFGLELGLIKDIGFRERVREVLSN